MKKLSVCICALFLGMGILAGCSKNEEDMKYLDVMKNYGLADINPDTCDF